MEVHANAQFIAWIQWRGRVAFLMPGVRARVSGRKPEMAALHGDTLGAKLKRRRVELKLRQMDAAKQIGVCETSIVDWETGQKQPFDRQYPAIIAFLGHEPWSEPRTLGERLSAERRRRGCGLAMSEWRPQISGLEYEEV